MSTKKSNPLAKLSDDEEVLARLEAEKTDAWGEYETLLGPADAAYKKYQKAANAYKEAVLYEKAKRQVMRDLINAAGKA